jgi:hypothetical protein
MRNRSLRKSLSLTLCFALLAIGGIAPSAASAQKKTPATGVISGVVQNEKGEAVPGATVRAVNTETKASRKAKANAEGAYRITRLAPGNYRIEVEAASFDKFVQEDIAVGALESTALNPSLKPAAAEVATTAATEPDKAVGADTQPKQQGAADAAAARPVSALPIITVPPLAAPPAGRANAIRLEGDAPAPRQTRQIAGTERGVLVMTPVNMMALTEQTALTPEEPAPVEIKAVHVPKEAPEQRGRAVEIPGPTTLLGRTYRNIRDKWGTEAQPQPQPQSPIPTIPSPPPSYTFRGDGLTFGSIPPDTMGAVGPNHAVTTTNEKVIIHNRAGQILSVVTLDAFWASTPALMNPDTFDPKILYDRFNDRFIFVVTANSFSPTSATLLAVSQTGDPTGTWFRYAVDADATATPFDPMTMTGGGAWADYPSIGFNKNWITVSINRFGYGTVSGFVGPSIYVFNKATAYAGTLIASTVFEGPFTACLEAPPDDQLDEVSCGFTFVPAITEDNTTNDHYILEDWDSRAGQLRLTRVTGTQASPTLIVGYQFPQSRYAWRFNSALIAGSGGYLPQRQQNILLPSGNRPTANDSRIQNVVLRNGSLWTTHTVMLARLLTPAGATVGGTANPDIRAAVQWWQIDPTIAQTATGQFALQNGYIQDPRADNCHNGIGGQRAGCTTANQKGDHYAYPTISVNANNDVLIGYSRFSPFTLPKAAYSFRAASDPANTFRDSMVFREGVGNYNIGAGNPFNIRWGDYSQTMVDPVNDIDFWTTQEFADYQREIFGPGGFAGVWATWWAQIKPSGTSSAAGSLIISEFRLRGPAGARDEFVELHNPSNTPFTVQTTDGSDGWTLAFSNAAGTVTALAVIPNGTVVPAKGYYLITNEVRAVASPGPPIVYIAPYSLSGAATGHPVRTADGDAMWTPDLTDNGGIALFRTNNAANFIEAARVDSVGFAALPAGNIYKEGMGLPTCTGTPNAQLSFVRKGGANPQDTNDNAADFDYISTNDGAQTMVCQPVLLGTPTPCNVDAPPGGCTGALPMMLTPATIRQ